MPTSTLAGEHSICDVCNRPDQPNNRLRIYTLGRSYIDHRFLHTRCLNGGGQYGVCAHCDRIEHLSMMVAGFCSQCRVECEDCGERFPAVDNGVCSSCGWMCVGCGIVHNDDQTWYTNHWDSDRYCLTCYEGDGDEEYDSDQECNGVRGYGHTHPERWFGGPLPRDKDNRRVGYYLGFELEISSARQDARPIHRWAEDNNLDGFFDCKQDSSVQGFEIATQPFTPQFFETLVADGRLDSFFTMLNDNYPLHRNQEPRDHGLHVHIGKIAFLRDPVGLAAFAYVLAQDEGKHLERIARRDPTSYCTRVPKPVSRTVVTTKQSQQQQRLYAAGHYPGGRDAINLSNGSTIEIRAFRSTRDADELAAAIRLVYVSAEYVRYLRSTGSGINPSALVWSEFCRWTAYAHPEAFASLADLDTPKVRRAIRQMAASSEPEYADDDPDDGLIYPPPSGLRQRLARIDEPTAEELARRRQTPEVQHMTLEQWVMDLRSRTGGCTHFGCCGITDGEREAYRVRSGQDLTATTSGYVIPSLRDVLIDNDAGSRSF